MTQCELPACVEARARWQEFHSRTLASEACIGMLRAEFNLAPINVKDAPPEQHCNEIIAEIKNLRAEIIALRARPVPSTGLGELDVRWQELVAEWNTSRRELRASHAELKAVLQLAVDKWLDDDEGNPATRAARAREVALKAIEAAESKLAVANRQREDCALFAKGLREPLAKMGILVREILAAAQPNKET